ncbi:hypothetical protein GN244_ATG04465 [Phytophthora infestans]|uniref:Peptidase S1 domain-containing protein n=1 Tax=Phytophthora infestans TaxID=4787 RepID=A0A833TH65_PHYIN|nr:hypothetical protein GN244_ATG04465 [Phytophthora infestans]
MGGPLIANNVVVGIANAHPGAAADCEELPGLYTRVSNVVDYTTDILNGGFSGNASEVLLFPATR